MRDDQLHNLLRGLEQDRGPDPAFAGALFDRLTAEAVPRASSRGTLLLLAAALIVVLAAGLAIGSGLVRLPIVVDASPSATPVTANPTPTPVATPPEPSTPGPTPSATAEPTLAGRILAVQAPEVVLRADPATDAEEVAVLRTGQRMGVVGGPTVADGVEWYAVRIGPGDLSGWVSAGPERTDLALVEDGGVAAACAGDGCPEGSGVYVADLSDGSLEKVADNPMWVGVWSPDGSLLAVSSAPAGTVALLDPEGNPVVGPRPVAVDLLAWAPDSRRLAWSTGEALMVAGLDLDPVELLRMDATVRPPTWSPDGTRFAFVQRPCPECDPAGRSRPPGTMWVVDVDGTDLRSLGTAATDFLEWTPDGRHLAFSTQGDDSAGPGLFLLPVDDGTPMTSIADDLVPGWAFWSPDGASLAYTTDDGLVVASGDGSDPRVLLERPSVSIPQLRWAPSGRHLLVEITDDAGSSIHIVDPSSGEVRDVFPDAPYFSVLMWQPRLVPLP